MENYECIQQMQTIDPTTSIGSIKKKKFTRFLKGKLSFSKKGIAEFDAHKNQESFRIKSFTKSNAWGLFPSRKDKFKKGDFIECYTLTGIN